MVEVFYELRNEYIKFSEIEVEIFAVIETFEEFLEFSNIVGAIDGSYVRIVLKDSVVDYFSRY